MRWDEAVAKVDRWLATSAGGVERLKCRATGLYPTRQSRDGWRVPVEFDSGTRRFDILIGESFPFEPPRFALVDRPPHLTWPHVESDGVLCLLPSAAAVSGSDPVALVKYLLGEAVNLVETSERGANADDFRAEFLSYWPNDSDAPLVRSLLEPHGPSRLVSVHRLKGLYVVAETSESLTSWLDHAVPVKDTRIREIDPALLVWLELPMLPAEYPKSAKDVVTLVQRAGLGPHLDRLGAEQCQRIVVIIGALSVNGPALAAIVLKPEKSVRAGPGWRSRAGVERGFRPGHAPAALVAQRFLATTRPAKASVERVDTAWIHGRDNDPDLSRLQRAKVAIVGCGSLGGALALGLAQAGVGSLELIDPELLTTANVGRHPLGSSEVGLSKAKALAARIRTDYPHIQRCEGVLASWQQTVARTPDHFLAADLIVSTIGEWGPEATLNAWRHDSHPRPNVLFGWTEPHAVAGHVVGLVGGQGCLACGVTEWGEPLSPVASWPNGTGQRGEPACGVLYQPYGPVEIVHIVALITEAAIDVLIGRATEPFHRIWVAREMILERAGGVWSDSWKADNKLDPKGARIEERSWRPRSDCPICGGGTR
ncbi:ThiF family adenylyltransferase [Pleomorphomonas carboxyditropha]